MNDPGDLTLERTLVGVVLPIVVCLVGAGVYLMVNRGPVPGLLLTIVGLVAITFISLRIVADRRGVRIAYGPLGWGYRGSLRFFGRAAIVLRGGEGLQLDLAGNKVLTITVDNADEGAGLINDLVGVSSQA